MPIRKQQSWSPFKSPQACRNLYFRALVNEYICTVIICKKSVAYRFSSLKSLSRPQEPPQNGPLNQGLVYWKTTWLRFFVSLKKSFNETPQQQWSIPRLCSANIYFFKANIRNPRNICEKCSKLTIKTPERRQRSGVFIVNFEHIWQILLGVPFVDFEQVNISCGNALILIKDKWSLWQFRRHVRKRKESNV